MKVVPIFPGSPANQHDNPSFQQRKDKLKNRMKELGSITVVVSDKPKVTQDQINRQLKNNQIL